MEKFNLGGQPSAELTAPTPKTTPSPPLTSSAEGCCHFKTHEEAQRGGATGSVAQHAQETGTFELRPPGSLRRTQATSQSP